MTNYSTIDTRTSYLEAVERLKNGHGPVAVDAERASGFRYTQRAYLIQVFRRDAGTFLFDPPPIGDFHELQNVIRDELWVIHAASQDLPCLREVGLNPARLFDTELAARLLGLQRAGLGPVVQELLGIHLAKEHSASDWSMRPLPEAWLTYAALDVEFLIDLHDTMAERLEKSNKTNIAEQEFEAVLTRQMKQPRTEPWRRLSGIHSIRGATNLAIARELWNARDELAREKDSSPGRLIPDSSLVTAAQINPSSKNELAKLRQFMGRTSRTEIDRWWAAIERGQHATDLPTQPTKNETIPAPRSWAEKNPAAERRLATARAMVDEISEKLSIPAENLLRPASLRCIAWSPPEPIQTVSIAEALHNQGARNWQIELLARAIAEAFTLANADSSQSDAEHPENVA